MSATTAGFRAPLTREVRIACLVLAMLLTVMLGVMRHTYVGSIRAANSNAPTYFPAAVRVSFFLRAFGNCASRSLHLLLV